MKRLTYEFVKEQFEKEGYMLLTEIYENQRQKLVYECCDGHRHSICWSDWKQDRRCPICSEARRVSKRRLDIEFIKFEFNSEGYTLLITDYINCDQKLEYICLEGHRHGISWHNWKNGYRCPYCYYMKHSVETSGIGHWNWKGGISCEPYCDAWADKEFKKDILERDNYECQNPNCWRTIKKLCVHHIDYNKKNCHPNNLITLCVSCNSQANFDREWHESFYKEIMHRNIYNYNYQLRRY